MTESPDTIDIRLDNLETRMTFQENELEHLDTKLVSITNIISTYMRANRARGNKRKTRNKRRTRGKKRKTRNKRR